MEPEHSPFGEEVAEAGEDVMEEGEGEEEDGPLEPRRLSHDLPPSRRGADSTARQRTMSAYESLTFPCYPSDAVIEGAGFEMPRALIAHGEAPPSARKWCAAPANL